MRAANAVQYSRYLTWPCLCLLGTGIGIGMAHAAEALFDPTQPYDAQRAPRSSTSTPTPLRLEAILHGAGRRLAIINGQLVHEGDRIAGSVIEAITPTSVRYLTHGQPHTISLAITSLPDAQLRIRPSLLPGTLIPPLKDTPP